VVIAGTSLPNQGISTTAIAGDGFWSFNTTGYRYFRVHMTAVTGTESITIVGTPGISTVGSSGGGETVSSAIAPNNTAAVVIKASPGQILSVHAFNSGTIPAFLKIYNAASATCGSGTPAVRWMIPAASGFVLVDPKGLNFSTGITYCLTLAISDADTTAPAASTYLVNVGFQ